VFPPKRSQVQIQRGVGYVYLRRLYQSNHDRDLVYLNKLCFLTMHIISYVFNHYISNIINEYKEYMILRNVMVSIVLSVCATFVAYKLLFTLKPFIKCF
jgi:uncharacterized membrane protein